MHYGKEQKISVKNRQLRTPRLKISHLEQHEKEELLRRNDLRQRSPYLSSSRLESSNLQGHEAGTSILLKVLQLKRSSHMLCWQPLILILGVRVASFCSRLLIGVVLTGSIRYCTWYILVPSSTRKLKEARGRYVLATTRTGVRIYPRVLTKYLLRYGVASFCGKGIVPTAVYGTRHIYRLPYEVPFVSGNVRPPASKGSAGFLKRPR